MKGSDIFVCLSYDIIRGKYVHLNKIHIQCYYHVYSRVAKDFINDSNGLTPKEQNL